MLTDLAIMATDVEPAGCSVQLVNNLYSRHEPSDAYVIMAVFGQQKLAWQLNLRRLQREVTQESAFLLDQRCPVTEGSQIVSMADMAAGLYI